MQTPRIPITSADLDWAMQAHKQFPKVTSYGFSLPRNYSDAWADGLDPGHLQEIAAARAFLRALAPTAPHRNLHGSYSLKHLAESWAGCYIREGAVILAALALGLAVKPYDHPGHGGYVGVTRSSVKKLLATAMNGEPPQDGAA
jgi:hypothetical protein